MDRVDYYFYGFIPEDYQNENDEFIKYYISRREQFQGYMSLEDYLNNMNAFKQNKKQMLNELSEIEKNQENSSTDKPVVKVVESQTDQGRVSSSSISSNNSSGLQEAYTFFEEIDEYILQDRFKSQMQQKKQKDNIQKKNQIEMQIKRLQKRTLKEAWKHLYHNPQQSELARQCFIHLQLHWHYSSWLYFVFREIKQSDKINECTINMNGLKLRDDKIENLTNQLLELIRECDNINVYKLIMTNNELEQINKLILFLPLKINHLTLELQNNKLKDSYFTQFYIPEVIQILTLYIENNPNLSSKCLSNLSKNTHKNLEVELFIDEHLFQNEAIIDFIGKCHSLKINDKLLIYNDSFLLDVQLDNVNESQFLKLATQILENINFDSQNPQTPHSTQEKLFIFSSRQNFGSKNQKSAKLINLIEDNKDRQNQQGSQPQLSNQNSQSKIKSQLDLETNNKEIQSYELLDKEKALASHGQKGDDDEDDDVAIPEKKDIILQINGIKIIDTQDDSQQTLNLSQFEMSIFDDRNVYKMIAKLPKIPTNIQVKNYDDMQEKDKQIIKLILSKKENIITINEKTYDMKSFAIDFSLFCEVEHELVFLVYNLQQNESIEKLDVQIDSLDRADNILHNLIDCYDSQDTSKLKELRIFTDIPYQQFFIKNEKRKFQLHYVPELPQYRKLSDNLIIVESKVSPKEQINTIQDETNSQFTLQ
ncbi:hypothetical protein ABPG74_006154 [Tetrahymena malaccensis]